MQSSGGGNMKKMKKCIDDNCQDRISALLDSLLLRVLSFLDMDDVVWTGVLSKRWDLLWTKVSVLRYWGDWPDENHSEEEMDGLVNFVNYTLSLTSPIDEFSLRFTIGQESTRGMSEKVKKMCTVLASQVDRWIRFASRRKAKELFIDLNLYDENVLPSNAPYKLPHHLYSNGCIQKLKLCYCLFKPVQQICWISLVVLHMFEMELSDEVIENILRGCPMLEEFSLTNIVGMTELSISSQKLHTLWMYRFSGSELRITAPYVDNLHLIGDIDGVHLTNVSSMVTVNFYPKIQMIDESQQIISSKLLTDLGHAEDLSVYTKCLQVFSMLEIQNRHLSPLGCKILQLQTRRSKWEMAGLVALLKACTNLQKLILHADEDDPTEVDNMFLEKHDFSEANYWSCLLQFSSLKTIKTVKIFDFTGESSEIALVEFLYMNAQVLQTMEIICRKGKDPSDHKAFSGKISEILLSLPRTYLATRVLFP